MACCCADCIELPTTPCLPSSGGPAQFLTHMSAHCAGLWTGLVPGCSNKGELVGLPSELLPLTLRVGPGLEVLSVPSLSSPSLPLSANVVCSEVAQSTLPGSPVRNPGIVSPELGQ